MAPTVKRALVIWSKENKTGIEPLSSVPPNARFDNAVSPVMFSGDKKYYPAKIVMISENLRDLETRQVAEEAEILNLQGRKESEIQDRSRRNRRQMVAAGAASSRDVAKALGMQPPVPKDMEATHKAAQKAKKDAKDLSTKAQLNADGVVLDSVRRDIFGVTGPSEQSKDNDSYSEGDDRQSVSSFGIDVISYDDDDDDHDGSQTAGNDEVGRTKSEKWCCCRSCRVLQKYDSLVYHNFLKDIFQLFEANAECDDVKYLELLPIPPEAKKVELTTGSGVFISASQKDQLKVDFRNKPTGLVRETLFALYGKQAFSVLTVTGKGKKKGAYTTPDNVNKAICCFVNRNVDKEKKIKLTDLSSLINKRAPEWRSKSTPSPKLHKKMMKKKQLQQSPFQVSPLKRTPQKTPLKTPQKTPVKSPLKTPVKSPLTKNSFTVQQPFDNQHSGWNVTSKQQNGVYEGSSTTGAWGPNYYSSYQYWNQAQQWGPPHRTQQWGPPHQTTTDQSWEACSGPGPSLPQAEPSQYYNL
ncbi:hypothetical protein KUF71_016627 [Frankliniella fusca]|uniref:Uncharacterized protein n=1 Tax=Frankliniella fusca TaxID=407009 RepID=A0AAE1HXD1_9NEOP|nr:hypothetical protein KUF71_016627 [Frankliniella fusca]